MRTTTSLVPAVIVFVLATFIVAWVLQDAVYFSLIVGIPVGVVFAALAFAGVTLYLERRHSARRAPKLRTGGADSECRRYADGSGEFK